MSFFSWIKNKYHDVSEAIFNFFTEVNDDKPISDHSIKEQQQVRAIFEAPKDKIKAPKGKKRVVLENSETHNQHSLPIIHHKQGPNKGRNR